MTLAQVFSCEFCKISKNTFCTEHLGATASVPCDLKALKSLIYQILFLKIDWNLIIKTCFLRTMAWSTHNGVEYIGLQWNKYLKISIRKELLKYIYRRNIAHWFELEYFTVFCDITFGPVLRNTIGVQELLLSIAKPFSRYSKSQNMFWKRFNSKCVLPLMPEACLDLCQISMMDFLGGWGNS